MCVLCAVRLSVPALTEPPALWAAQALTSIHKRHEPPTRALAPGARTNSPPPSNNPPTHAQETALELLRYLALLRKQQQATEGDTRARMSPSCSMDALWHHMLLNTREWGWDGMRG